MLCVSDDNLPFLSCYRADLLAYPFNLIIECPLFVEVAHLVSVSLVLEVLALLRGKCLPLLPDLLHDLKGSHFRVVIHNQGSRLQKVSSDTKFLLLSRKSCRPTGISWAS